MEHYFPLVGNTWLACRRRPAIVALITCSFLSAAGSIGCTLYQMPPADPSTEAAIAQANQSCGPTTGETAERIAAMPLLVPLDMAGAVEPGNPLLENSNASKPECQQARARATQAVETGNQNACVQFASTALAKYLIDQWQHLSWNAGNSPRTGASFRRVPSSTSHRDRESSSIRVSRHRGNRDNRSKSCARTVPTSFW